MSNVIDEKIVEAKFDNKQFVAAINDTIAALEKLTASLKLDNAAQGINNLDAAGKKFSLKNMFDQATATVTAFNTFGSSLVTTFGNIGSKATAVGATVARAFGISIPPVTPKMDTGQLENGVGRSVGMLEKLRGALGLRGSTQGIEAASNAMSKFDTSQAVAAIDTMASRFSALGIMAGTVFATITQQAVAAGERMLKAFSFDIVKSGFTEYETKLGSIQTILANTQRHGTGLATVNAELNKLNKYADRTIYNFSEMTKNASLFTNSGMKIEDATTVIKGFSNAAAASGTKADDAARAAYQLSQAFSAGTIRLMDWRSLTNVGMGNKNMQEGLINIAKAMGTLKEGSETAKLATTDFNSSLEDKWLSADVMSKYLRVMSGDMKEAELNSLGLSDAAKKSLKDQAATAFDAATKVRSFTQLIGTLKEAVGSGWTDSFELIIGNFTQATNLFTSVNNVLSDIVSKSSDARNHMIKAWGDAGGKLAIFEALKNTWQGLVIMVKTLQGAFREIFPKKTGVDLANMSKTFRDFTEHLKMGAETADKVKRTFAGVFAIFDIAKEVVVQVAKGVLELFGAFNKSHDAKGGLLDFTAGVGDFLVSLDKTIAKSGAIAAAIKTLVSVLKVPVDIIKDVAQWIGRLFTGFDLGGAKKMTDSFDRINARLTPLEAFSKRVQSLFSAIGNTIGKIGDYIGKAAVKIGQTFASAFGPETFNKTLDLINAGLLGGILLLLKKFVNGGDLKVEVGGGLVSSIKGAMGAVTDTMKSMQAQIKAETILKIAGALAILTGSIFVLSTIDSDKLTKAMIGMGIGMAALQASLVTLTTVLSMKDVIKLPFISGAILKLSAALVLYATALKILASISLGDTIQAMIALGGSLAAIALAMKLMPKGMNKQATALLILSVALNAIATALKIFGTMNWDEIAHGLTGLAGALVVIAGAMHIMPHGMIAQAAALLALGVALNAIGAAMKIFNTMSWNAMAHGLAALAGALVVIAASMRLMPNGVNMLLQAVALNAVAVALGVLAGVLKIMGSFSWETIGKGLITLGGALLILALGLNAMNGAVLGAGALLIASGALALLIPQLVILGNLSIGTIITALVTLAATFVILGVAGAALAPMVPALIGLGVALLLVGGAVALVGIGVLAMATAFGIFVSAAMAGFAVVVQLINVFVQQIPNALRAFGEGIVAMVKVLGAAQKEFTKLFFMIINSIIDAVTKNGPKIQKLFTDLISGFLDAIIKVTPKIGQALLVLITTGLKVLEVAIPRFAQTGLNIMLGLLNALNSKISQIIKVSTDIIVKFIQGISAGLPRIIDAGVKLIISFVNGVADAIDKNSTAMGEAGARLGIAMVTGMAKGIGGMAHVVVDKARELAESLPGWVKKVLGIHSPSKVFEKIGEFVNEGFAKGLTGTKDQVLGAMDHINELIKNAKDNAVKDVADLNSKITKLNQKKLEDDKAIAKQRQLIAEIEARNTEVELTGKKITEAQRQAAHEKEKARNADKIKDIQAAKEKLEKLTNARQQDVVAIAEAEKALRQAQYEQQLATDANVALNITYKDQITQLQNMADAHAKLKTDIEDANKAVEAAIKTRDDYKKSISQQYDALPDINKDTTLTDYIAGLEKQTANTQAFAETLEGLHQYGLSDQLYQEFLKKGVDSLPFIQEVLKGGKASVEAINASAQALANVADALGTTASNAMYQAGVDTAQGLLDGLKSQEAALQAEMERIAAILAQTAKDQLKIKSPSRVFIKMGVFVGEGLAVGLRDSSGMVSNASSELGKNAVDSMQKTLELLGNNVGGHLELNPTITPVLDLSSVRKGAAQLEGMIPGQSISVDSSYSKAKEVSAGYRQNQEAAMVPAGADQAPVVFSYTQNNYSPKSLTSAEIYRQTDNQISTVKGALTKKNA